MILRTAFSEYSQRRGVATAVFPLPVTPTGQLRSPVRTNSTVAVLPMPLLDAPQRVTTVGDPATCWKNKADSFTQVCNTVTSNRSGLCDACVRAMKETADAKY